MGEGVLVQHYEVRSGRRARALWPLGRVDGWNARPVCVRPLGRIPSAAPRAAR